MTTIKSYTDIEQSKKLAEILPLESADGFWEFHTEWGEFEDKWEGYEDYPSAEPYLEYTRNENEWKEEKQDIPCWSLSALLDILPKHIGDYRIYLYYDAGEYHCEYIGNGDVMFTLEETKADNPIDACYEMIIKLNEQNLI